MTTELEFLGRVAIYIISRIHATGEVHRRSRTQISGPHTRRVGYEKNQAFLVSGQIVHLSWQPKETKRGILPDLSLQFHLSHFETFSAFLVWAKEVFGKAFHLIFDAKIYRIDCPIDVERGFQGIFESLGQARARSYKEYRSNSRTFYLGKPPRQTCCYEKDVPRGGLDYQRKKNADRPINELVRVVRIEPRFKRKFRPILRLRDIEQLRNFNPFEHLQVQKVSPLVLSSDLNPKTKLMLDAFRWRCQELGVQEAKKSFSQAGNFHRTVGKHLDRNVEPNLHKAWKRRMKRFLGEKPIQIPNKVDELAIIREICLEGEVSNG